MEPEYPQFLDDESDLSDDDDWSEDILNGNIPIHPWRKELDTQLFDPLLRTVSATLS